jgi:hypothetical protein
MTSINRRLFLSLATALAPGAAIAHHGWGGYDTSKSFTVTGEILKSTYENPHCEIEIEVEGKHWHFVLAPPSRMQRRGITPDSIAPGKTCTVFGYPNTSNPERLTQVSDPSFDETKERSDKILGHAPAAADVIVYECSGLMFWFTQKKFVGSYLAFKATRRS